MHLAKRPKQFLKWCAFLAGTLMLLFMLGEFFPMFSLPIQRAWHDRNAKRLFREQFATPGHYEPMPYEELSALLGPSFTEGDAVERFGWPNQHLRGWAGSAFFDEFLYRVPWPLRTEETRDMVTAFVLQFGSDLVLKVWFPMVISGIPIRDDFGVLTPQGHELSADEKWPGRRSPP